MRVDQSAGPSRVLSVIALTIWFLLLAVAPAQAGQDASFAIVPDRQPVIRGQEPAWKGEWDLARQLVRGGRYQEAAQIYRSLLDRNSDIPQARQELGAVLLELGDFAGAEKVYESLDTIFPDHPPVLVGLARALIGQQRYGAALAVLERAAASEPDDDAILLLTGRCLLSLDRRTEAVPVLQRYLLHNPDNITIRRQLATIAFDLRMDDLARKLLTGLASRADTDTTVLEMAARVHARLGLDNLAAGYWQRLLEKDGSVPAAHRFLAAFFEKNGALEKALSHLLALRETAGSSGTIDRRIGLLYEKLGRHRQARPFLERALVDKPRDLAVVEGLIRVYASLGRKDDTLAMLERYFELESHPPEARIRQAAELYADQGALRQAIDLYRSLLAQNPDDPELLEILAHDLLAVGERQGALAMWQHLVGLYPDRLDIHLAMADLLEKLGRDRELAPVLEKIIALDPGNMKATARLAVLTFKDGDRARSFALFRRLQACGGVCRDILAERAWLAEGFFLDDHAFQDYQTLWNEGGGNRDILRGCLRTAGRAGRRPAVFRYAALLEEKADRADRLLITRAFQDLGALEQAAGRAARLLAENPEDSAAVLLYADILLGQNRTALAEQILRQALWRRGADAGILLALAETAIQAGDLEQADRWLARLVVTDGRVVTAEYGEIPVSWQASLVRARLLAARDRPRSVLAEIDRLTDRLMATADLPAALLVDMAALLLDAGQPAAAVRLAERHRPDTVLGRIAAGAVRRAAFTRKSPGQRPGAREMRVEQEAGGDRALVLRLARFYLRLQCPACVRELAGKATMAQSATMTLLLVQACEQQGALDEAATILGKRLDADLPWMRLLLVGILYRQGDFVAALAELEPLLARFPDRPDLRLLQARILWGDRKWSQALVEYRRILTPPVTGAIPAGAGQQAGAPTATDLLSWLRPGPSDGMAVLLAAQEEGASPPGLAAALERVVRYRWQCRVREEYAARLAVERREFHRAARLYRVLLQREPGETSFLFDLAGAYSRLQRLGEEAAVYYELSLLQPRYPGLAAASTRNRLARRPRLAVLTEVGQRRGWDDHQAIDWWRSGVRFWLSPKLQHEFTLNTERIRYRATTADHRTDRAGRFLLQYATSFSHGLSLSLAMGRPALDRGADTGLLAAAVRGEFGDRLEGFVRYRRDVVDDTLTSLASGINREELAAGIAFDPLSRLQLGADYFFAEYSDGNVTEGYKLHVFSTLHREPSLLRIGYTYDFRDSRDSSLPGLLLGGSGSSSNHPYWTPRNYWLNNFTLHYKHLLSREHFGRGIPRYFEIRCSAGHDSDGYARQELRAAVFAELTEHFIFKADLGIVSSQSHRERLAGISLEYRW